MGDGQREKGSDQVIGHGDEHEKGKRQKKNKTTRPTDINVRPS